MVYCPIDHQMSVYHTENEIVKLPAMIEVPAEIEGGNGQCFLGFDDKDLFNLFAVK